MTTKPHTKKLCPKKSLPDAALPEGDAAALDRFCNDLAPPQDEMPFESWKTAFHDLDLKIPLWMSAHDAEQGCHQIVRFCRSVQGDGQSRGERQSASHPVVVPPGARDGECVVVCGLGDRSARGCGDLVIVFRVKARV